MAKTIDFSILTIGNRNEFCENCTCKGHNPPLEVIDDENGYSFYVMNRLQLNEFWMCCLNDQKFFCLLICPESCTVCKWVKSVYNELKDNFFFDFDKSKTDQPVLWKVYSSYLDKKLRPCLVQIEVIRTT